MQILGKVCLGHHESLQIFGLRRDLSYLGASERYNYSERDEKGYSLGFSSEVRRIFNAFYTAPRFSQMDASEGRGASVLARGLELLHQIWSQRDPKLCFDRYEGRPGVVLYTSPRRLPGGIMMPYALSSSKQNECGSAKTVDVINSKITVSSLTQSSAVCRGNENSPGFLHCG